MSAKLAIVVAAAMIFASAGSLGGASKPTPKSIGDGLICQCGCTQTVTECNHFECPSRAEMNALTAKEIAAGKDETTILQDFVKHYGVQVLASPPATGFNLAVWIFPGAGLMLGLALVIIFIRKWRKPRPKFSDAPDAPIDPKVIAAIEEEMRKVSG
jgi:cytochrome c-type biogenesis protein CcmH/NrfF